MRSYKIALSLLVFHAALACGEGALSTSGHDDGGTIPDAHAADDGGAPAPQIDEEPCSKTVEKGAVTYVYAEHAYPGKTVNDLAAVLILPHTTDPTLPGYEWGAGHGYLRDGYVAVLCGTTTTQTIDRVRFISP